MAERKNVHFNLDELSDVDRKKIEDLVKKTEQQKKANKAKKKAQEDADRVLAEYVRKHGENITLSHDDALLLDFGKKAWAELKNNGMQANNIDSGLNYLRAVLSNHGGNGQNS